MPPIDPMSRGELSLFKFSISVLLGGTVLGIASCRDPVSSEAEISQPHFAAAQSWERGSFTADNTVFVPCLGENVRFFGPVPFQFHTVRTPSGTFNSKFQLRPGAVSPPFFAHALTSGQVYEFANGGTYNETFHSAVGEVFRFKINETYIAEGGDRLEADAFVHVTVNANGEVAVEKIEPFAFTCVDRP